ncbi:hypothetical protein KNO81_39665 [Paraburkholderia sediminicola]|nr:hypothetical protein [Paraburkholderia sediminicola]
MDTTHSIGLAGISVGAVFVGLVPGEPLEASAIRILSGVLIFNAVLTVGVVAALIVWWRRRGAAAQRQIDWIRAVRNSGHIARDES